MYKHLISEQSYTISVILQNGMNRKDSHLIVESTYFLLDLERSFDTMSHGKLIEVLSRKYGRGELHRLYTYISSKRCVMVSELFVESKKGTPQGNYLESDVKPSLHRSVSFPDRDDRICVIDEAVGTIDANFRCYVIFQVYSASEACCLEVAVRFRLMDGRGCQLPMVTQMMLTTDRQMSLYTTAVSMKLSRGGRGVFPLLKLVK